MAKGPLGTRENPVITESKWFADHKARIRERDQKTAERWARVHARPNSWRVVKWTFWAILILIAIFTVINYVNQP